MCVPTWVPPSRPHWGWEASGGNFLHFISLFIFEHHIQKYISLTVCQYSRPCTSSTLLSFRPNLICRFHFFCLALYWRTPPCAERFYYQILTCDASLPTRLNMEITLKCWWFRLTEKRLVYAYTYAYINVCYREMLSRIRPEMEHQVDCAVVAPSGIRQCSSVKTLLVHSASDRVGHVLAF